MQGHLFSKTIQLTFYKHYIAIKKRQSASSYRFFRNFATVKMDFERIRQTVYDIVVCIPEGCVTTYSDVARYAGMIGHARVVGKILRSTPLDLAIPSHRVVGSGGRLANVPENQRELLEEEGVPFLKSGRVDMRNAYWDYNSLLRF